jgi:hypothetical protein
MNVAPQILFFNSKLEKLTKAEKEEDDFKWYKEKAKWALISCHAPDYVKMKIAYDLHNNILNEDDFKYVTNPFNSDNFKLPAKMVNRDIISPKIKVMEGLERKRPFVWKAVAVNPEATTRKEQAFVDEIKSFVQRSLVDPIKKELEQQMMQNPEAQKNPQEAQAQMEEELKMRTPPEVKKYMEREHQDPLEIQTNHILKYLIQEKDLRRKFNRGFKHSLLSGMELYYVGIGDGEPDMKYLNPLRFKFLKSEESDFFEDGEACCYEYDWTLTQVVSFFGNEITDEELKILQNNLYGNINSVNNTINWDNEGINKLKRIGCPVQHCVWRALREIRTLKYSDENGEEKEMLVSEDYELNLEMGDIEINSEWLPEVCETYILPNDIFKRMRPVPGQFRDMTRLKQTKLPYYGGLVDDMNSEITSIADRLKLPQYLFDIIHYRIELLMAGDKGKKLLMNINAVPSEAGIDLQMWQEFFESTPYGWFNPNEEGAEATDANNVAKILDLSTINQIDGYIKLAEQVKMSAAEVVGISPQLEAQIGANEEVGTTNAALQQSSIILEPYFEYHDLIKRNVLTGLVEQAKVAYEDNPGKRLSYVLDDEGVMLFSLDTNLMQNASVGIYLSNSRKIEDIKEQITQFSHAALQNQQIKFSDLISILKEETVAEAESTLKASEKAMEEQTTKSQQMQQQHEKEMAEMAEKSKVDDRAFQKEMLILKEEEQRKTKLAEAALMGASFNPDADADKDGVNDFVEMAKKFADMQIKGEQLQLEIDKFKQKEKNDAEKIGLEKDKLKVMKQKNAIGK